MEVVIFKDLIDSYISHNEFVSVNYMVKEFDITIIDDRK